jgi:putative ABC transport system ATP-binding protein
VSRPAEVGFPALRLERVAMEFGDRTVFEDFDLTVEAGSVLGLGGSSGSGKSVLCLMLAGLLPPTRGRVVRMAPGGGGDGWSTGIVFQTHGLVSGLTAEENVWLPLQARALRPAQIAERTGWSLAAVGLDKHATRLVDVLSGGERQRVGIARALAADPVALIADEPTSELDPDNRERVLELLVRHALGGRIVVVASDDAEVIGRCSRVVDLDVVEGGRAARR